MEHPLLQVLDPAQIGTKPLTTGKGRGEAPEVTRRARKLHQWPDRRPDPRHPCQGRLQRSVQMEGVRRIAGAARAACTSFDRTAAPRSRGGRPRRSRPVHRFAPRLDAAPSQRPRSAARIPLDTSHRMPMPVLPLERQLFGRATTSLDRSQEIRSAMKLYRMIWWYQADRYRKLGWTVTDEPGCARIEAWREASPGLGKAPAFEK